MHCYPTWDAGLGPCDWGSSLNLLLRGAPHPAAGTAQRVPRDGAREHLRGARLGAELFPKNGRICREFQQLRRCFDGKAAKGPLGSGDKRSTLEN